MRSVYTITILFFCFYSIDINAQSPNWSWAKSSDNNTTTSSLSPDTNGNVYVTGAYYTDTFFLGVDTLVTADAYSNTFLAKYDPSGNLTWWRRAKMTSSYGTNDYNSLDEGLSVSTDAQGNAYITGLFGGATIAFGNDSLVNPCLTSLFIVKYDPSGDEVWAKAVGVSGNNGVLGSGIHVDGSGNVLVTGVFTGPSVIFGTDTLVGLPPADSGNDARVFIAKYDPSGNVIWARCPGVGIAVFGIVGNDDPVITADANDNIYAAGVIVDTLFGDTVSDIGYFILKYDPSGHAAWAKAVKTNLNENIGQTGICTDIQGNIYLTGVFDTTAIFASFDTLTNSAALGYGTIFIAKYDSSGSLIWTKTPGGNSINLSGGISTDVQGNVYVAGEFGGNYDDDIVYRTDSAINQCIYSVYIAKFDPSGNVIWMTSTGGDDVTVGLAFGFAVDAMGDAYITGRYTGDYMTFGTDTLMSPYIMNGGFRSLFVAKLDTSYPTGIKTISPPASGNLTVYPNPSTSTFYFGGMQTGSVIEVHNMLGEVVYSGQANADIYPVSLSGHTKGMYFYKVRSISGTIRQGKMILE